MPRTFREAFEARGTFLADVCLRVAEHFGIADDEDAYRQAHADDRPQLRLAEGPGRPSEGATP